MTFLVTRGAAGHPGALAVEALLAPRRRPRRHRRHRPRHRPARPCSAALVLSPAAWTTTTRRRSRLAWRGWAGCCWCRPTRSGSGSPSIGRSSRRRRASASSRSPTPASCEPTPPPSSWRPSTRRPKNSSRSSASRTSCCATAGTSRTTRRRRHPPRVQRADRRGRRGPDWRGRPGRLRGGCRGRPAHRRRRRHGPELAGAPGLHPGRVRRDAGRAGRPGDRLHPYVSGGVRRRTGLGRPARLPTRRPSQTVTAASPPVTSSTNPAL